VSEFPDAAFSLIHDIQSRFVQLEPEGEPGVIPDAYLDYASQCLNHVGDWQRVSTEEVTVWHQEFVWRKGLERSWGWISRSDCNLGYQ